MPLRHDIIDHMLRVLGESGVSYDQSLHPTVQTCNRVLDATDTEQQERGWWFNKEFKLKLLPDVNGEVILPGNMLDGRPTLINRQNVEVKNRIVFRNGKVYDNIDHTYAINDAVYVDVTLQIPLDGCPSAFQTYVQHKAAETVFFDEDGDINKMQRLEYRTSRAWQTLQAAHLKNTAVNSQDGMVASVLQSGWRPSISSRNPNYIGGRIR